MGHSLRMLMRVAGRVRRATGRTMASAGSSAPTPVKATAPRPAQSNATLRPLPDVEPVRGRESRGVRAAVALSARLAVGLAPEWRQERFTPDRAEALLSDAPDIVLLEVGAHGVPGWFHAAALDAALSELQQSGASVLVWFTDDAVIRQADNAAVDAAVARANAVFAVDAETADAVRTHWTGTAVTVLEPAAQPRRHRPTTGGPGARRALGGLLVLDPSAPTDDGAEELGDVVAPAVKPMPRADLDVWRCAEAAVPPADRLPTALRDRLAGSVPAGRLDAVTGQYAVLLDAGRESAASSWSVVEAAAAQCAVVTTENGSRRLPAGLSELVPAADESKALRSELVARLRQPELRDREALRLHRAVLDQHTFGHRVDIMLAAVGRPMGPPPGSVSAIVPTNREHEIDNVLDNIGRQHHRELELVLVLHGLALDHTELRARAAAAGIDSLVVVDADPALTLGACMNLGIDAASGSYIAKMDDDNYYGRHFLTDLLSAFEYTDAGIVGKWAHYVWLRSIDAVVLRYVDAEHRPERRIQGGSMLFDGDVARSLRFSDLPRGVDSDILDRAAEAGVGIYSGDRFNYVSIRGLDRHAHTWTVTDSTFMTGTGRLVFYGDPRPHVDI